MNIAGFVESLKYMGIGMAGIFIIIGMLVILIQLCGKVFSSAGDKK